MVMACGVMLPGLLAAQARQPELTPQQSVGKGLFFQNCALCHLPEKENNKSLSEVGKSIGPLLTGIFKKSPAPREEVIRMFIQRGTQKMPGFQYGLDAKQIDSIIAYLKTQ